MAQTNQTQNANVTQPALVHAYGDEWLDVPERTTAFTAQDLAPHGVPPHTPNAEYWVCYGELCAYTPGVPGTTTLLGTWDDDTQTWLAPFAR